ncbi:MAG TPA: hypothetical protein PKE47_05635 [Verrucomicrobiota bacterium]|nr:hypothetical protein [Verrucomicrobiota bacterium]
MLPDEQSGPDQLAVLRRLSPAERWRAARQWYWTLRRHKTAFLAQQHPEWPPERVAAEVRRQFLHARS